MTLFRNPDAVARPATNQHEPSTRASCSCSCSSELSRLEAEIARLKEERGDYRKEANIQLERNRELDQAVKEHKAHARMFAKAADSEKAEAKYWRGRSDAAESKLSALIAAVSEIAEKSKAEARAATETAKEAESKRMYVTSAGQIALAVVNQEIAKALTAALQQAIGDK